MKITTQYLDTRLDELFVEHGFTVLLENHLPRLKNLAKTNEAIKVSPAEAYKYDYNYYNLLRYKGVDYRIHWITMRCNDRVDPYAKCEDVRTIYVPPLDEIERLLNYYVAAKTKLEEELDAK